MIQKTIIESLLVPDAGIPAQSIDCENRDPFGLAVRLTSRSMQEALNRCVHQFDTVLVSFCSPELEEYRNGEEFKAYQSTMNLFLDDRLVDSRLVTLSNRRHQFFVAIPRLLAARTLSVQSGKNAGMSIPFVPTFRFHLCAVNREDIYTRLEEKIIWIFGAARSGTTWLLHDMLGGIRSFSIPIDDTGTRPVDEPNLGQFLGAADPNPEPLYWLFSGKVVRDRSRQLDANGLEFEVDPMFERVYDRVSGKKESVFEGKNSAAVRRAMRSLVFMTIINNWGCIGYDRVALKCPNEIQAADLLCEYFRRSRVIAIYRDPREIIRSHFGAFASRVLNESSDARLREFSISYWAHLLARQFQVLNRALESVPESQKCVVTYEELRRRNFDVFRRLFSFIDSRIDPAMMKRIEDSCRFEVVKNSAKGHGQPSDIAQIEIFKEVFHRSEIQIMEDVLGPWIVQMGYGLLCTGQDGKEPAASSSGSTSLPVPGLSPAISRISREGVHNDGWSGGYYLLKATVLKAITQCTIRLYSPAEFYAGMKNFRFSCRVNNRYQNFVTRKEDECVLELPVDLRPSDALEIEITADQHFRPLEFGIPDERILSFKADLEFESHAETEQTSDQLIDELQDEVARLGSWGRSLDAAVAERDRQIAELQEENERLGAWGRELDGMIAERDRQIAKLQTEMERLGPWAHGLDAQIAERDTCIAELQAEVERLGAWGRALDHRLEAETRERAQETAFPQDRMEHHDGTMTREPDSPGLNR